MLRPVSWNAGEPFAGSGAKVVLIDLDRLLSDGREVGLRLRQGKATRQMALVFAAREE